MFVAKQFVLPAAPTLRAPAAAPPTSAPAIAAAKVAAASRRSSSVRAAKALRAGLSGLGCACQRQAAARRKAAALGALGFSFRELLEGAGIGAGADALKQFLVRPAKPVVTHSVTYSDTQQGVPAPQVPVTPAGSPPPVCQPGYQYANGQCLPASAAGNQTASTPPATPSWFSQETIISGVSNGVVAAGGAAGFLLLAMLLKSRGRR